MERNWDLQLRRAKIIYRLIMGVLRPTRFPLPDHDDDDTSKHCKDCLVTRLHRPYIALPLWFSQNHVTEMDDLRETIFGSSAYKGGSSSSLHRLSKSRSSAVGVSYIREDHLPDWTQIKSHTTPSSFASYIASIIYGGHAETRLLSIFGMGPKFAFQRVREATSFI